MTFIPWGPASIQVATVCTTKAATATTAAKASNTITGSDPLHPLSTISTGTNHRLPMPSVTGFMLANHTSMGEFLQIGAPYDKLRKRNAFLDNYRKEPMFMDTLDQFDMARDQKDTTTFYGQKQLENCLNKTQVSPKIFLSGIDYPYLVSNLPVVKCFRKVLIPTPCDPNKFNLYCCACDCDESRVKMNQ
jgi:hypothetical protein